MNQEIGIAVRESFGDIGILDLNGKDTRIASGNNTFRNIYFIAPLVLSDLDSAANITLNSVPYPINILSFLHLCTPIFTKVCVIAAKRAII